MRQRADSGSFQRPEIAPINDATKLVREPFAIVRSVLKDAIRDARRIFDTQPEQPKDERASR